jgi:20S proteasome alpha/beta subunit
LVRRVADVMQEYTQSGFVFINKKSKDHNSIFLFKSILPHSGVRPFGVSLLIAGWDVDEDCPYLYQCDPSVNK